MAEKISRILLSVVLTLSVLVGAFIGFQRHFVENQNKTVELVMDYNDLKILSGTAYFSFDKLLSEIKSRGIVSIGLREETLPEAASIGELVYITGSGIKRFPSINSHLSDLNKNGKISDGKVYIMAENTLVRKRIQDQLHVFVPQKSFKNLGGKVFEISEEEIMMREPGVGISEATKKYLNKKGFRVIPRVWNDPRYNVVSKINLLKGSDCIVFDGEEITGYPENIALLAKAMKKNKIKYGNVEIVKQDGDNKLKFLMREEIVRVHSIPRDEMKKITRDEAISRFSKAAKERNIRMIYIRPFLPPQISEDPIKYNLEYLSMIQKDLESKGFVLGKAEDFKSFYPLGWQIIILGLGVVIGVLLLADCFVPITWYFTWPILLVSSFVFVFIGAGRYTFLLEKYLALIAAVVFPSYAVISQFSKLRPLPGKTTDVNAAYLVLNVFSETFIGIIIIVGLLSNTVFMLGSQGFVGIKFALILPIFIVATFFFFNSDKGFNFNSFREKMKNILSATFPVWVFGLVLVCLGLLFLLVARSGNFTIPVPQFEKMARMLLEKMLVIRPRTKEFLIGYPILMFSAFMFIRGKWKEWLPVALALGVIGPVSMLNSFCHVHTPVYISIIRSVSGLVIGIVIGWLAWFFVNRILIKK